MGIYWVYFSNDGNELKLQIEARTRVEAVTEAEKIAEKMRSTIGWTHTHTSACR